MHIVDVLLGKTPGRRRSSLWPALRNEFIKANPTCEACGGDSDLEVHHIVPFHERPDLELEPENLMVLCSRKKYGIHCHLLLGHRGNYRRINKNAKSDARRLLAYLKQGQQMNHRICGDEHRTCGNEH